MNLESKIEAVLFFRGESVSIKKLSSLLDVSEDNIKAGLESLESALSERGIRLMRKDDEVSLGTAPEAGSLIEKITKEELSKDIGKAGLETLSIILYKGPISRREIDYIRGVNSNFILRNLMIRGLVEKVSNPKDQRSFLYKPTFELLAFLGINKLDDLPEFGSVSRELSDFADSLEKGGEEAGPDLRNDGK